MEPFFNNLVFGTPFPFFSPSRTNNLRRVDVGGIYELKTNAIQITDESADFGINPCQYNALPCESIVLLKIHAGVPAASSSLPVKIVAPIVGSSTVNGTGSSTTGTTKVPVVDHSGTPITGASASGTTEALAYINKKSGIIRLLGFQQPTGD